MWYDAAKYLAGEYGNFGNGHGEFYLCYTIGDEPEKHAIIGTIDRHNRYCDEIGEPLHYENPDMNFIAVQSLPDLPQDGEVKWNI